MLHQAPPDVFSDLRDDGVAKGSQTVHPSGYPMSHSTHVGFKLPLPSVAFREAGKDACRPPRARHPAPGGPIQSRAFGVGHAFTAVARRSPKPLPFMCFCLCLCTSRRAITDSTNSFTLNAPASGVGHKPDAVTAVRGADGGRGYAIPFRVIPARGQVSDHVSKSPSKQTCDVLHEDVARS